MHEAIQLLQNWLQEEKNLGAPNPQQAVLSTATREAVPHSRVVAIREINEQDLIFFTQAGTRKVREITENPQASLVFWFELTQREVIIEASVSALSSSENARYWDSYPREAQARFMAYAPSSAQAIVSKEMLEQKRQIILQNEAKNFPVSEYYCGFRLKPQRFMFYTYRLDVLSDVFEFKYQHGNWVKQLLSP